MSCFNVPTMVFCVQYSDETLAVFKSYKLDDMQASKRKMKEMRTSAGDHVYFAKFLTSEKVSSFNQLFNRKQTSVIDLITQGKFPFVCS